MAKADTFALWGSEMTTWYDWLWHVGYVSIGCYVGGWTAVTCAAFSVVIFMCSAAGEWHGVQGQLIRANYLEKHGVVLTRG